jgi:hypothetical protein
MRTGCEQGVRGVCGVCRVRVGAGRRVECVAARARAPMPRTHCMTQHTITSIISSTRTSGRSTPRTQAARHTHKHAPFGWCRSTAPSTAGNTRPTLLPLVLSSHARCLLSGTTARLACSAREGAAWCDAPRPPGAGGEPEPTYSEWTSKHQKVCASTTAAVHASRVCTHIAAPANTHTHRRTPAASSHFSLGSLSSVCSWLRSGASDSARSASALKSETLVCVGVCVGVCVCVWGGGGAGGPGRNTRVSRPGEGGGQHTRGGA